MDTDTAAPTILTNDLEVGARILYPHDQRNGAPVDRTVTVTGIVEYPATRVLYFAEGGYGIADRDKALALAAPITELRPDPIARSLNSSATTPGWRTDYREQQLPAPTRPTRGDREVMRAGGILCLQCLYYGLSHSGDHTVPGVCGDHDRPRPCAECAAD